MDAVQNRSRRAARKQKPSAVLLVLEVVEGLTNQGAGNLERGRNPAFAARRYKEF